MKRVLVTGATGKIGSLLVPRLASYEDIHVRAFSRTADGLFQVKPGSVELVRGAFENAEQVRAAVKDIDTLILITPASANAAWQASLMLEAAIEARVQKIVRVSVFKAAIDGPTDITRYHGETDKQIQTSGIDYTIMRPGFFMQNLLFLASQTIAREDKLYFGTGEGKLGLIDLRDIVDCIEQIVVKGGHSNETITLTGPESISFSHIADRLSNILKRPIQYVSISPEKVEQSIQAKGMGNWYAGVMRQLCEQYKNNWGNITTNNIERITGRAPRSFDVFAREILCPAVKLQRDSLVTAFGN